MTVHGQRQWQTGDLVRLGPTDEVWEVTTFWTGPGGRPMVTLEQVVGDLVVVAHAEASDLRALLD